MMNFINDPSNFSFLFMSMILFGVVFSVSLYLLDIRAVKKRQHYRRLGPQIHDFKRSKRL